ncbi:protein kinase [Nonomuraea sp. NPDC023979]|uniref:protein kinase domain-containing protein n=1 Tax=Nonomuraea sp. NPDC023979 TaxID=3154796 RepID=UPI0033D58C8E
MPGDPDRLGGYWPAGRLSASRRGVVYDAYDDEGRRFAVLVPRGALPPIRPVAHPCLAEVVEVRPDAAPAYLVTAFADGPSLREAVERHGPYSGGELVTLASAVAAALAALHEAGVAHQDLRPEKVLLSADGPKVVGIGGPGAVAGTRTYMAPEVFTGEPAGPAGDVFAWGALVLYAATGRDPFSGASLGEVMHRLLSADPDLTVLPGTLRPLVGRALAKDPAARPSAADLPGPPPGGPAVVLAPGLTGPPPLGEVAEQVYATLTGPQRAELPGLLLTLLEGGPAHDEHGTLARLEEAGLLVRPSLRVPPVETPAGTLVAIGGHGIVPASAALYRAWPRLRTWTALHPDTGHPDTDHPAPDHPAPEDTPATVHLPATAPADEPPLTDSPAGELPHAASPAGGLRGRLSGGDRREQPPAAPSAGARRSVPAPEAEGRVRRFRPPRRFHGPGARWRRRSGVAALAAAVALLGVAVVTVKERPEQVSRDNARLVAARAEALRTEDPQTAMRLSVAAWRLAPVREARAALQASLSQEELGVFTDPVPTRGARYRLSGDSLVRWEGDAVTAWDVPTGRRLATHPLPPATTGVSDDGRYAETAGGTPVAVATGAQTDAAFLVSVGGRTELFSGGERLLEVAGGRVALSPDGRRAAVSRPDGRVELWDVPRRALTRAIRVAPEEGAAPLAFSPDGRLLAVAGAKTFLIGASTTRTLTPTSDAPTSEAPAPAEAASEDTAPAEAASGEPSGPPVFSPDGRLLAVASGDAVRLWRVGDGRLLKSVALQSPGHSYTFSADGRALHYLSGPGTVISLDVQETGEARADAVREVCAKAGGLSEAEWRRLIPETGYRQVC